MSRFFSRFWSWFFGLMTSVEPATPLALFRIGVGLSLLLLLLPLLFSSAGQDVVQFAFSDVHAGGYRDLRPTPGIKLFGTADVATLRLLFGVCAVCGVLITAGLFGRVPVLVAAVLSKIALSQNLEVSGAGDALLANALFLLLLGDVTATLSLDCKLRTGRYVDDTPVPSWPRRIALFQLVVVYTTTGYQKLVSTAWTPLDGCSALYQILQSPHWATFPQLIYDTGGALKIPLALMTAVTILWECGFFLVLKKPRWRIGFVVVGVAVHIGIYVLMEVGIFSVLSLAFYPLLFSPEVVAQLKGWRRGASASPPATDRGP